MERQIIYDRWLEFSLNLADIFEITPARKQKLKDNIENYITMFASDSVYGDRPITGWDCAPEGWHCIGDHVDDYFSKYQVWDRHEETYTGKFSNQILSCIRAGLDVAVPDMCSGGVVGFTIGNLRAAYKGEIPQWLIEVLELKGDEQDNEYIWL